MLHHLEMAQGQGACLRKSLLVFINQMRATLSGIDWLRHSHWVIHSQTHIRNLFLHPRLPFISTSALILSLILKSWLLCTQGKNGFVCSYHFATPYGMQPFTVFLISVHFGKQYQIFRDHGDRVAILVSSGPEESNWICMWNKNLLSAISCTIVLLSERKSKTLLPSAWQWLSAGRMAGQSPHKMASILHTKFSSAFSLMKIFEFFPLKFVPYG